MRLCLGKHSTSCLGEHPVCTWVPLFNHQGFKVLQGHQTLRESVLHLNNYLPRFLIINSFNLFTLNQFHIIILLFSGKLPSFSTPESDFRRCISLSGLSNVSLEAFPPFSAGVPRCLLIFPLDSSLGQLDRILSSVHLVSFHPWLTFHTLNITEEWSRPNFSAWKREQYSNMGLDIFRRLCN